MAQETTAGQGWRSRRRGALTRYPGPGQRRNGLVKLPVSHKNLEPTKGEHMRKLLVTAAAMAVVALGTLAGCRHRESGMPMRCSGRFLPLL
jgi:hypothetical protein